MMVVNWSLVTAPRSELSRKAFDSSPRASLICWPFPSAIDALALTTSATGHCPCRHRAANRTVCRERRAPGRTRPGLGAVQPDGVVVLQCRPIVIRRGQLDLPVGQDRVRDGHRLRVGRDRNVLVHGELDFDVSALRSDLGDLADRHAEHRDRVALVKSGRTVELGGHSDGVDRVLDERPAGGRHHHGQHQTRATRANTLLRKRSFAVLVVLDHPELLGPAADCTHPGVHQQAVGCVEVDRVAGAGGVGQPAQRRGPACRVLRSRSSCLPSMSDSSRMFTRSFSSSGRSSMTMPLSVWTRLVSAAIIAWKDRAG